MKIAIIGTHSTGKTTLIELVANKLREKNQKVVCLPELTRLCPYPINKNTTIEAQRWILNNQIEKENSLYRDGTFLICDRSTIDNFAYMHRTAGIHNVDVSKEEKIASAHMKSYDLVFKTRKLDIEPEEDGFRSCDPEFRDTIDSLIDHFLKKYSIPYLLLPATIEYLVHVEFIVGKLLPKSDGEFTPAIEQLFTPAI